MRRCQRLPEVTHPGDRAAATPGLFKSCARQKSAVIAADFAWHVRARRVLISGQADDGLQAPAINKR